MFFIGNFILEVEDTPWEGPDFARPVFGLVPSTGTSNAHFTGCQRKNDTMNDTNCSDTKNEENARADARVAEP
jgi:hypothetical protein